MSEANDNNTPLPPLATLEGATKGKKRRGRPPGSSSRSKYQARRIRRETAGANLAFESAFGHIPATPVAEAPPREAEVVPAATVVVNRDEDDDFGVHWTAHDDDEDNENKEDIYNEEEGDVGFGSPDIYDVQELIELCLEDPGIDVEHNAHDEVKQLKKDYIGKNSKISYRYSLVNFLFYTYKFQKHLMHKSWIKILGTYRNIQNEKEQEIQVKKMIRKLVRRADENCPPIDFDSYKPSHFLRYLLALQTSEGKRFGPSTYNSRRSSLHHLFTIYNKKQTKEFKEELSLLFKSLRRRITEEKQEGDGRIQTANSPIMYKLYRRMNEYMLMQCIKESVFARAFFCITWNLICHSKNTTTILLHHLEWSDDCLNIYFAHMKNDQLGDRKRDPRHLYANPIDPTVCPIIGTCYLLFYLFNYRYKRFKFVSR